MGKGNFLPGQYESVYNFHFDDLARAYFGDKEIDRDGDNTQLYQVAYENAMDYLKACIEKNTALSNHFVLAKKDKWLSMNRESFLIVAESDLYKIVIQDDGVRFIVALLIDDDAYNYDLSESDIENKLKDTYEFFDNALKKVLLGFLIDLYKPNGAWTSGKVSDNG
jgi:hypothetical protein